MPAIFTHVQFGKEVVNALQGEWEALAKRHPAAFYLGTQGPDILFYHKPLKKREKNPVRKLGWDLHAQAAAPFFRQVAKALTKTQDDGAKAYAMGFLCHFTLDSLCHPYIDEHSVNGLSHGKIEAELDKFQLRKTGNPERGMNAAELFFPCEESGRVSAEILGVPEENMQIALRSMRKINRLFSHKSGVVHGFCHCVLSIAGMNKTFGEMFLYKKQDERCKPLLPTLNELFEGAIPVACERIRAFFARLPEIAADGDLHDDCYRYNYSGKEEL